MNGEQQSDPPCNLCRQIKDLMYGDVCAECVEQALLKHLPRLEQVLEAKYGLMLDRWLARGRLIEAHWVITHEEFQVSRDRLKRLLRETIEEALEKEWIELDIPGGEFWNPTKSDQLIEHIYQQCTEELQQVIADSIVQALSTAPTEEAERDLIEVAYGKRRVRKRYVREEAISAIALSKGTILTLPMRALLELRYRADGGKSAYAEVSEGEISSVWKEVADVLPAEIVELINEDGSL
jgi:hypothetical protein